MGHKQKMAIAHDILNEISTGSTLVPGCSNSPHADFSIELTESNEYQSSRAAMKLFGLIFDCICATF